MGILLESDIGLCCTACMPLSMISTFKEIIKKGKEMSEARKDRIMLDEYLIAKGFVKKSGKIDYARFYNLADIRQPTWARYFNKENDNAPIDTLLKIILALRMPTEDAITFMTYAGGGFYNGNERDMIILSFIESDYLGLTDVVDIQNKVFDLLEYYFQGENGANYNNLYDFN